MEDLNKTMKQFDRSFMEYSTLKKEKQRIIFLVHMEHFIKMNHMLIHKPNLNKLKRI